MSTILHRREMNVAITADEAGRELANTSCDVQSVFFASMANEIELRTICPRPFGRSGERPTQSWGDSCRMIADELTLTGRDLIAGYLETLIEHLREVRECSACDGTGRVPDHSGNFPDRPGVTAGPCVEYTECPKCNGKKVV